MIKKWSKKVTEESHALEKMFISYINDLTFHYCEKKDRKRLTDKVSELLKLVEEKLQVEVMNIANDLEKQFKIFCHHHPDVAQYVEMDATFDLSNNNVQFSEFPSASREPTQLDHLDSQNRFRVQHGFLPLKFGSILEEMD